MGAKHMRAVNRKILYRTLLIMGAVFSSAIFFTLCPNCSDVWKTVLQLFASWGGGFFTSALVSLLIERIDERREAQMVSEQREYLLSDVRTLLPNLLRNEISVLSQYVAICNNKDIDKTGMKNSNMTFFSMVGCLSDYLKKIIQIRSRNFSIHGTANMDGNWQTRNLQKEELFFDNSLAYYERLKNCLSCIIIKKEIYIDRLLSKFDLENLQKIIDVINEVITYSHHKQLNSTIDYKKAFLSKLPELGKIVSIAENQTYMISQASED